MSGMRYFLSPPVDLRMATTLTVAGVVWMVGPWVALLVATAAWLVISFGEVVGR